MSNQHTPGPWRVDHDAVTGGLRVHAAGVPGIACAIQRDCAPLSLPEISWNTTEANAHLIAAAPELLAELRADLEMLITLRDKHLSHAAAVVRALAQKRIEATEAAIAKAEDDQ